METHGADKLLEVERIHVFHAHVADGFRAQVFQFDAQQRAAEDVAVRTVVYQKLDGRDDVGAELHFVEEDERFALNEWDGRERRQTQQKVAAAARALKGVDGFRLFDKVDFDETLERLAELSDGIGLSRLPRARDEQRVA